MAIRQNSSTRFLPCHSPDLGDHSPPPALTLRQEQALHPWESECGLSASSAPPLLLFQQAFLVRQDSLLYKTVDNLSPSVAQSTLWCYESQPTGETFESAPS